MTEETPQNSQDLLLQNQAEYHRQLNDFVTVLPDLLQDPQKMSAWLDQLKAESKTVPLWLAAVIKIKITELTMNPKSDVRKIKDQNYWIPRMRVSVPILDPEFGHSASERTYLLQQIITTFCQGTMGLTCDDVLEIPAAKQDLPPEWQSETSDWTFYFRPSNQDKPNL